MYKYIITPLLLCCLTSPVLADDVKLQENHPDRYVVVKGDTLWDISARFLKDPWQWPKVWRMNRDQVKNPHRIYPGDVVALDMSNDQPELKLLSQQTITLDPNIRIESLEKEAVPTIQPSVIAPFLSQPMIIEADQLDSSPIIIAGEESRVAITAGSTAYANKISDGDGLHWQIYRSGKTLVDPDTKEILGTEAIYLGDANVVKYGEPAKITVTRFKEEIFPNDKLVLAVDKIPDDYIPRAPETQISGRIMTIYGGVAETGRNSIVSINRGKTDGLEEGHVLAINRLGRLVKNPDPKLIEDAKKNKEARLKELKSSHAAKEQIEAIESIDPNMIKLPDERIGLVMIFRTFDRVSYALIMQAAESIHVLDTVTTP